MHGQVKGMRWPAPSHEQLQLVRKQIHGDTAGFAEHFAVCVHPQRRAAPDRKALSLIREEPVEFQVVSIVSGRKDPEEIHAVEVSGAAHVQKAVTVYGIGTEFEPAAFVAGVHDNGKKGAGILPAHAVTGDLHVHHGTRQDHVDRLAYIDQFAHPDVVEQRLERRTVRLLTDRRVEAYAGADIKEPHGRGIRGDAAIRQAVPAAGRRQRPVGKGVQKRRLVVVGHSSYIAGADDPAAKNGVDQFIPASADPDAFDEVVTRAGLDESDSCVFKVPDSVDHRVHCAVTAQDDQIAVLPFGCQFGADLFDRVGS